MKITVLNGINETNVVYKTLIGQLTEKNHILKNFHLPDMKVASCRGCFGCWLRTPGICILDDDGRKIAQAVIASDLLVIVSPVTFGGYSYHIKKAVDRLIPLISPYFMKIKGEIHHRPRYKKYPKLLVIGVMPYEDKESSTIFETLARRNAVNFFSPSSNVHIFIENQPPLEFEHHIAEFVQLIRGSMVEQEVV